MKESKRSGWLARTFYLRPETVAALRRYVLTCQIEGNGVADQSEAVDQALQAWLEGIGHPCEGESKIYSEPLLNQADADNAKACIFHLLEEKVDKDLYDKINTLSVKELLEIRLKQGQHVKSKAAYALHRSGVSCYGHSPNFVRIEFDSSIFNLSPWRDRNWIQVLSLLPRVVEREYHGRFRGGGYLEVPNFYFARFGLVFKSFDLAID